MLPRGPMDWNLGRASQRSMDWNLGHASQRSMDLNLNMLPRGPRIEVWTCFLEVQWIEILDVLPRGPKTEFWLCFLKVHGLKFGRAS